MIGPLSSRAVGGAALAAGLLLAGCSSENDVPPTVASAPNGGTQINTDTGSGGTFPDINSVPTQRPTSTIQDLNTAPDGLSGASGGAQYGEPLVGGPTSSAQPPAPPPPEPVPEQPLAPIPDPSVQTQGSDASGTAVPAPEQPAAEAAAADAAPAPEEAPAPANEPIATPEIAEPQPMEPAVEPMPQAAETTPAPTQAEPASESQGQTIVAQEPQTPPAEPASETAPATPAAPASQEPAAAPQGSSPQLQPESQLALAPGGGQAPAPGAARQPQAPAAAYDYPASSPQAYGITPPNPAASAYQANSASYGGANDGTAMPSPGFANYGQPAYGGQPVGLIYFGEGSNELSSDSRDVLRQIADMQRGYGGVVHVIGHASMGTGAADANRRISEARAQAVAEQLVEYGVPREAIQTVAAGDAQPLYSEATPSGEAGNRRADVYLGAY